MADEEQAQAQVASVQMGDTVLFQIGEGQWRPAVVVKASDDVCNLHVFLDGPYDSGVRFATTYQAGVKKGNEVLQWKPRA